MIKANDIKTLEIISEAMYEDGEEYSYSNLYVGHDGGRDLKFIRKYNQVQEIMNLSVGELLAEYINENILHFYKQI